ncbi:phenazine biosynthesis protein PhzF (plasmid) [Lactiplantibacillus plantarum subsp. plantarum]|uniref:PhzF family phenazine biosynthesis protein n=1 Tax=Lactiplantibacillus plantarum TaxID=1590 RepID=UPI000CD35F01|nr:PhzF family phenazine biosynthesis protein [Lactiplantibacillus plantarum]AUV74111.1 phenazine biosynthesis protein PhzF [Lactiplantibacillus plantarum subsp. plantarum]
MNVSVYIASAFSKNGAGGNKAGVVFMNQPLQVSQKKEIARQLGYAETAFISQSKVADFRLEYFTPKEEVDLCGHATIATFSILRYLKNLSKEQYHIETNSGILVINIKDSVIFMQQNKPTFYEELLPGELAECFDVDSIDREYPIQIVSTGLKDILIPIKSKQALHELQPNFDKIKDISEKHDVIGMHLYTIQEKRIVCRNYAPLYDIDEESATGTSSCAVAGYLYAHNYLRQNMYVFNQGYSLNAPSEILVKLTHDQENNITSIFAGGRGYYCETKQLLV